MPRGLARCAKRRGGEAALILAGALALPQGGVAAAGALPIPERTVLASGVTVLALPSRESGVVSLALVTRHGGVAYDPPGREGLGNLAHRMLLKGTARRTGAAVTAAFDSMGARTGAQTDQELGVLTLTATESAFEPALDLLLECVREPAFDVDEVEAEKRKILSEIEARKDRLLTRAMDLFHEAYFAGHPYHAPLSGYAEVVSSLGAESAREYVRRHYHPAEIVVSVSGAFDPVRILDRLAAGLDAPGERPPLFEEPVERPAAGERIEQTESRRSQTAWLVMGFPAPLPGTPDEASFTVLRAVLSGSMGSRLFHELRDKRSLAYEVGGFYRNGAHGSFFGAYMGTRGEQYATARDALVEEIRRVMVEPPTETELRDARQFVRGDYLLRLERNEDRARFFGSCEALGLGPEYGRAFLDAVASVTGEDVTRVAEASFRVEPVIGAVVPEAGP
jgi:zinc protease